MTQNVLLAGATGMLGGRIAHHLLLEPEIHLRLLVRSAERPNQQALLKPLIERGAEVVQGDLSDPPSLDRATQGADVIISAVQGGPDVIVDGQVALAQSGARNGARRILPSDYGLDLFQATPGEHLMFDLRRTADEQIAATGIQQINVLQGAFMEMFAPGAGTFDDDTGTVTYWGDGTQMIDTTSLEDTARMVARIALDPGVQEGKFAFAGDRLSILDATKVIEAQTGRTFKHLVMGTEAELRAAHSQALQETSHPFAAVLLAYQLYMLIGQTNLSHLQNGRYPDVPLENFTQFAARALPQRRTA
ncbi:NAD-dependent epimerase/dehydratase family protein [Deinococcus sp. Arct2-2]|uniref:NmrA family NAD(P)-binding protein n=1 Tax=Deinococcus sp. Arct2-2 TaxID=2568653 RepID=UPI0010A43B9A|nr:NmrA family NAD(P)-binding protein [Deinococcus sp. Arct2-2]THF68385.1 NAD-dependent epimerase/dehydratase family protein [Deinococcus sp. Arct2-2]